MDAVRIREAVPGDAAAIGALHVASWRETYSGLLPAALLDGLSAEARAAMWAAALEDPQAFGGMTLLVATGAGAMVGFAACSAQRDEALEARGYDGELGAVYVLRAHQRSGLGRSLMRLMAARLIENGQRAASLWVLRDNLPARAFYERMGGEIVGAREEEQDGVSFAELAYGWPALSALLA